MLQFILATFLAITTITGCAAGPASNPEPEPVCEDGYVYQYATEKCVPGADHA
jgi:hypothetical protein